MREREKTSDGKEVENSRLRVKSSRGEGFTRAVASNGIICLLLA